MRVFGRSASLVTIVGGLGFAASIGYCAWTYFVTWRVPPAARFSVQHLALDVLLFVVFATHHSVTARPAIKAEIARLVGDGSVRTVFVLIVSVLLVIVCAAWQPVGGSVYRLPRLPADIVGGIQIAGVCLFALAVRSIDPLELAGFESVWPNVLHDDGPYGWVRHPLYTAWIVITFGSPTMTADRLLFAVVTCAYLCV